MLKRFMLLMAIAAFAVAVAAPAAFAKGGIWRAHEVPSGKDWGQAVSGLAKMYPGAVAEHIQMMKAAD